MSSSEDTVTEDVLAYLTLAFGIPLFWLVYVNRNLFPITQRQPLLVVASGLALMAVLVLWLLTPSHPSITIIITKIQGNILLGFVFVSIFVRVFLLFMDTGLAVERVKGKPGWYIRHRRFRSRSFITKVIVGLMIMHLALLILQLFDGQDNLKPSREEDSAATSSLIFAVIVILYLITYAIMSVFIGGKRDGFYIKREFKAIGIVSVVLIFIWIVWVALNLPCALPGCAVLWLWAAGIWIFICSAVMPLIIAHRDIRFRWWPRIRWRLGQKQTSQTHSSRDSSDFSREFSLGDHEDIPPPSVIPNLTDAQWDELKHVPLAKFLTYPPAKEAFRSFTVREFSVENVLFIDAVKEYKATFDANKDKVKALHEQFISPSAPNQVNLPGDVVQRMNARMKEEGLLLTDLFDEASEHIMKVMGRDTFKRFQDTIEWRTHVVVFHIRAPSPKETSSASASSASCSSTNSEPNAPPAIIVDASGCTTTSTPVTPVTPLIDSATTSSAPPTPSGSFLAEPEAAELELMPPASIGSTQIETQSGPLESV